MVLLIETPFTVVGVSETSFEQLAGAAAAEAGDESGIAASEPTATATANRRNERVLRIRSPPEKT